ncbi:MAG: hypothetical protein H6637_05470 [Ardenticatenales bacterium]|nr:hypothetical protein [Ardenticatenales bacterium]
MARKVKPKVPQRAVVPGDAETVELASVPYEVRVDLKAMRIIYKETGINIFRDTEGVTRLFMDINPDSISLLLYACLRHPERLALTQDDVDELVTIDSFEPLAEALMTRFADFMPEADEEDEEGEGEQAPGE